MRVLGISSSPRARSNSEALLDAALNGARAAGAQVEKLKVAALEIAPCRACDACVKNVHCVVGDDFQRVYDLLLSVPRVILATPITYMSANAQAKCLIDRAQCLYNRKYVRKEEIPSDVPRRGAVIAVSGRKHPKAFEGLSLTTKYFFDSLQMEMVKELYVPGLDGPGEAAKRPELLERARELGERLARP